ncbi:MAG: PAS domain-containing protein [Syntrophobacteraceae bacterium]|jgi:PAS domain S-box-containing protein|nr:PAS domain-containing protein [Syntrophobacteraceae bacterium]
MFPSVSLRSILFVLVMLAVLPLWGLAFYTNFEQREQGIRELESDIQRWTQFQAVNQQIYLGSARQLLLTLAQASEVVGDDPERCSQYLSGLIEHYLEYWILAAADLQGQAYCSSVPLIRPLKYGRDRWFQQALTTMDFSVSGLKSDPLAGEPTVYIGYPIVDERGAQKGVLLAGLELTRLELWGSDENLPEGSIIALFDRLGTVVAHYPDPEKWVGKALQSTALVTNVLAWGEGLVRDSTFDGRERLFGFQRLRYPVDTELYLVVGMPMDLALARAERTLRRNLAGFFLVAIMALAAAWLSGNRLILRRIRLLLDSLQKLERGDLKTRSGLHRGRDEFSLLASGIDSMAASLEEQSFRLHQAEERYRMLVEQIPAVTYVISVEADRPFLYISPQIDVLLGFTPQEWRADPMLWEARIHPEDREMVLAETRRGLGEHSRIGFNVEYRMIARDGRVVWVLDQTVPEYDAEGRLRNLRGLVLDVTERHTYEERLLTYQEQLRSLATQLGVAEEHERRRIATELHDHVAQKLAISKIKMEGLVSSPLSIEAHEAITQVYELISQAVQDTRSLMNKISSPILHELGLEAALEWLVEEFQRMHGLVCYYEDDGELKPLERDIGALLFQAANELLVNVVKHSGVEECELRVRREGSWIRVTVQDDGVGFDPSRIGRARRMEGGFGLFSIRERMNGIGGRLEIESSPGEGARLSLLAPLRESRGVGETASP